MGLTRLAVVAVLAVAGAGCSEGDEESITARSGALASSATSEDGRFRCTARVPTGRLERGRETGMTFTIQNLAGKPEHHVADLTAGFVEVADSDGDVLWSTREEHGLRIGVSPSRETIPPGKSIVAPTHDVAVRWPGKLELRPECDVGGATLELPPIEVAVRSAGKAPTAEEALERVLAETRGLLSSCRPRSDGTWTKGSIPPPAAVKEIPPAADTAATTIKAPPLAARCSAVVGEQPGFRTVSLRVVAPPDAPDVAFPRYLKALRLPGSDAIELMRWDFVVTQDEVRESEPPSHVFRTASKQGVMSPTFELRHGRWRQSDAAACGARGFGEGIHFISACSP
ncbi:MAG: hypothetical protein M3M94_00055 [Actinomycetota bacterium]|nr:hypothetical protein [Actinomycetota bacterium]